MFFFNQDRPGAPLELWAGVECTVNRVGDEYFDQLERSGHAHRLTDLYLFAALGIKTLRYPILWERTAPYGLDQIDWRWADARLARLRLLGLRPIVGLVHHGSGPRYTSLLDPQFPQKLANYALAVARRYPWVDHFTPVNEPLTTARFSGLYGHWYPHSRDDLTFAHAVLNQCRGVALSMQAIRQVNPTAQLVQTEDLGKTYSCPRLSYQAEFENARRWLTYDLLCGRLDKQHPLWGYFTWLGIAQADLAWFLDHPCPPDILGINYYVTSERYLDDRVHLYPRHAVGGNEREPYVDIEAVRVCLEGLTEPAALLNEAWERYQLPLAVTEAHMGGTREEQMRWLMEVWSAAEEVRRQGGDVRAVTLWSLLGAYDWDSLVTREAGHYESGAFDLRAPEPRPTALCALACHLATGRGVDHPVLSQPGWWRRPERLLYPPTSRGETMGDFTTPAIWQRQPSRPILITGATGTLGQAAGRLCQQRGLAYRLLSRADMDIADAQSVSLALDELEPWAVFNAAGYVRVDDAEYEPDRCRRENTEGPAVLAAACAQRGIRLVTFSSDLVFDGRKTTPYLESDKVAPLNEYGRSKADAETDVLDILPDALVIRASAFFGPWDDHNFVTQTLRALAAGRAVVAADDLTVSPTYVPDLIQASLDLLIDDETGIWHLANVGAVTWAALARSVAALAGAPASQVEGRPAETLGYLAQRPAYSALGSERGRLLPPLEDTLGRYLHAARDSVGGCQPRVAVSRRSATIMFDAKGPEPAGEGEQDDSQADGQEEGLRRQAGGQRLGGHSDGEGDGNQ